MARPLPSDDPFEIFNHYPGWARGLTAFGGVFCVLVPAWELRHAFLQLGWWTLFFGIIVGGAWSVGGKLLAGAVFGEALHWSFRDQRLILQRRTMLGVRTEVLSAADVTGSEIHVSTWDSGPDTYSVIVHFRAARSAVTPGYSTRETAEAVRAEIMSRLGVAQGDEGRSD